jgi:hypothetical protein
LFYKSCLNLKRGLERGIEASPRYHHKFKQYSIYSHVCATY